MKPIQECQVKIQKVDMHRCPKCPKVFIMHGDLFKHIKEHDEMFLTHMLSVSVNIEKVQIWECNSCSRGFLNQRQLALHKLEHIQKSVNEAKQKKISYGKTIVKPFKCPKCDYTFASKNTLLEHSIVHEPYPHICYCGIGYYKIKDLKSHQKLVNCQKSHKLKVDKTVKTKKQKINTAQISKKKNRGRPTLREKIVFKTAPVHLEPLNIVFPLTSDNKFMCTECPKIYQSSAAVQIHYRTAHRGERPYVCLECGVSFTQGGSLKIHQKIHIGVREFQCKYCPKDFLSIYSMLIHERTHTGYKPYKCDFCEKSFSDPTAYKRHERIHTGDKRYRCKYCPMAFTDSSGLYAHNKRHEKRKDFECKQCGKKFYSKSDRKLHIQRIHSHEYKFSCVPCNRFFKLRSYLQQHNKRRHETKKESYYCHKCPKQLDNKNSLTKHLNIVHNESQNYECQICYKKFINETGLNSHMSIHSKNKPFECDHCGRKNYTKAALSKHIIREHLNIK